MMRTFIPPTSFISSPSTEKERLLYVSTSVASGFYPRHGFLISPQVNPQYKYFCVVLPPEIKQVSQKYWQQSHKAGLTMPFIITDYMKREIDNLRISLPPVEEKVISQIKSAWQSKELEFWKLITKLFPEEIKWIKSLEIRLTKIGSLSTHYLLTKKTGQHLVINLREDADVNQIANLIILSLIYPLKNDLNLTFSKRQTLRDFIMTRNPLKKLFPTWSPKFYENIKLPLNLKKQSQNYLLSLGLPQLVDPLLIINQNKDIFGVKEEKVLDALLKNQTEIISYDDMADLIWGQGEFKSYWALNKIIQRIQKKLIGIGANEVKISGIRGRGYKLTIQSQLD